MNIDKVKEHVAKTFAPEDVSVERYNGGELIEVTVTFSGEVSRAMVGSTSPMSDAEACNLVDAAIVDLLS